MNIFNWFKKDDVDFKFVDLTREAFTHFPPIPAKDIKPLREYQQEKYGEYKFPTCPGMHDYSRLGYIIPAWCDFHIKSNTAGTVAMIGSVGKDRQKRNHNFREPLEMDPKIADGFINYQDNIKPSVRIFPAPWKIQRTSQNLSFMALPALFHSNFLDDLFVYPGTIDFRNGFQEVNFVVSPKRKCNITIKAGDPVLHIIPFYTNKDIIASYGAASMHEEAAAIRMKWFHEKNFYRKFHLNKKRFKIRKENDIK